MTSLAQNRGAGVETPRRRGARTGGAVKVGWIGLVPFGVYALLFLAIPAVLAVASGFFTENGVFTLANFDTFAERMIANMRFNGYSRDAVLAPAVRARFDETIAATGDNFDQPVRIDCFGPAA